MTHPTRRPLVQPPTPASLGDRVKALFTGAPLYPPGEVHYHAEDYDVARVPSISRIAAGDPIAFARRMDRIFKADHEKLDSLSNVDDLYHEMEFDALVASSLGHLDEAMTLRPSISVPDEFDGFCAYVTREAAGFPQDARRRGMDSYARGFVLGEIRLERIARGEFRGLHTVAEVRRIERSSYRLAEDQYSRPAQLEVDVASQWGTASPASAMRGTSYLNLRSHPYQTRVIVPGDPEWERYLFLTWPPRSNRLAGVGALAAAWPWYYFALHLRQWMMVLGERTGTPILVAEFAGGTVAPGGSYPTTREGMLTVLEDIQTGFRGVIPEGYKVSALATGAEGLAGLLSTLFDSCIKMIQLAIERQVVAGGLEAQGGTLGANETVFGGTFGNLISALNRRQASILAGLLERLIQINFGQQVDVEVSFELPDPVAEAERVNRIERWVAAGIYDKREPWLRKIADPDAPALDAELAQEIQEGGKAMAGVQESGAPPAAPNTEQAVEVVDRYVGGELGERMATLLLGALLSVDPETAAAILADELARRGVEPAGVTPEAPSPQVAQAGLPEASPGTPATELDDPEEGPAPPVEQSGGGFLPPRDLARAAAMGVELAGQNRHDLEVDARAAAFARVLTSRQPLTAAQVERLAAWHQLHPAKLGTPGWDNTGPSVDYLEWLMHGGEVAASWADAAEEVAEAPTPPTFSEAASLSAERMRGAILRISPMVASETYDATRPPPVLAQVARALAHLLPDADERTDAAARIRGKLGAALARAGSGEERQTIVQTFAERYSDPGNLTEEIN